MIQHKYSKGEMFKQCTRLHISKARSVYPYFVNQRITSMFFVTHSELSQFHNYLFLLETRNINEPL